MTCFYPTKSKAIHINTVGWLKSLDLRLLLPAILVMLYLPAQAADYEQTESSKMLNAFNQFVISETAAKYCLLPSQEEFSKFDANFDVVSNFAFQELSQQYPYIQQKKISETLVLKARALSLSTEHQIKTRGCKDPAIQSILQQYQLQARWEPAIAF